MLGRIIAATVGEKIAARHGNGAKGLLIGALAPTIIRRAFGPLGLVLAGGYFAKKYYDGRRARRTPGPSTDI